MGERFISYRMKPIDVDKAVEWVSNNNHSSKDLNGKMGHLLSNYLPDLLTNLPPVDTLPPLHPDTRKVIANAAKHFTLLRTPLHVDERSGLVDEFPEREMPFRVMKQLAYLAKGMQCLQEDLSAPLSEQMTQALEWTAYSLANDKRRAYMRAVVALDHQSLAITTRNVSSVCGLHNDIVHRGLSHLQALDIISLSNEEQGRSREYSIENRELCKLVRKLEPMFIREDQLEE